MKKTIKTLGLIFAAALAFTSCKQATSESKKSIDGPLFDSKELTVDATELKIADGNWTYREVSKTTDAQDSAQFEFSVKNGAVDNKSNIILTMSKSGKTPASITEEQKEKYKKQGYNFDGDKFSFYKEYDKTALENKISSKAQSDPAYREKFTNAMSTKSTATNSDDQEIIDYFTVVLYSSKLSSFNTKNIPANTKTNADNTKYYWKSKDTTECYLSKN